MRTIPIGQHSHSGVFTNGSDLYTRGPHGEGVEVDRTVTGEDGSTYRPFPPHATKLSAIVKRRCRTWPFRPDSRVLYLGAGAGTTVSFMSDICRKGQIIAVEFAPEPFRQLVEVARRRSNVVPVMADARDPKAYSAQVGPPVDVIYQDVAQRDQWEIARRNAVSHLARGGTIVLVVKASSMDVSKGAEEVFRSVRRAIGESGFSVEEFLDLEPFYRGHGVFTIRRAE